MPLIIAFAINWDKYVVYKGASKVSTGISLSVGGILCVCLVVLSLIDKLPKVNGIFFTSFVFIIICLLEPLLQDLKLLWGVFLLGKLIDAIFFELPIKKVKQDILIEKGAIRTSAEVEKAVKKYLGGGQ
jgi:hypothetical protein